MTHEQILAAVPDVVIYAFDHGWRLWGAPYKYSISDTWMYGRWIPSTLEQS
jgi:hypothetical protein